MELLQRLADTLGVNYTILYQWLVFVASLTVLYIFLFKPTVSYLDEREDKMLEKGDKFDDLRNQIDEMVSKYDQFIKKALIEAGDIRSEMKRKASAKQEEILKKSRAEAAKIVDDMKSEVAKVESDIRGELEKDASDIADMVLDRLLV
jgi:F-type H+-transporting ATPase subunit b